MSLTRCPSELDYLDYIVGIDEVGTGTLAGPVVSAAVILPKDFDNELINDSKKIKNHKMRIEALSIIRENAIAYGVGFNSVERIEEVNILQANFEAMHIAVDKLETEFNIHAEHLLVDGNKFKPYYNTPHTTIIKGDGTYYSIAAASILAKVIRDEYMIKLSKEYPHYGWDTNFGYGTLKHRNAIIEHGPTPYHRMSFLGNIIPKNINKLF